MTDLEKMTDYSWLLRVQFCPVCNFAESRIAIDSAVADFDCPNCRSATLSRFYSVDSEVHKAKIRQWNKGNFVSLARWKTIRPAPLLRAARAKRTG